MREIKQKIGMGKFKTIVSLLIIIVILCAIVWWLYNLRPVQLKKIDDVLNIVSELATIIGVAGVFYAIMSFNESKKESMKNEESRIKNEESRLMDNSIEVLKVFSESIIPGFGKFFNDCHTNYATIRAAAIQDVKDEEGNLLTELPEELEERIIVQAKLQSGGISIFNQLEQICAYIAYDLVISDVVYPTLHTAFLKYIDDNRDLLNEITSKDVPYKNIHTVYDMWKKLADEEFLDYQQKVLDQKRAILRQNQ